MPVIRLNSSEAMRRWGDLLAAAGTGMVDAVIEEGGRPVAVLIAFRDYLAIQDDLERLRANAAATGFQPQADEAGTSRGESRSGAGEYSPF